MSNYPGGGSTPKVFIRDPDRGYRQWLLSEIWNGTTEGGRFVPNIDDMIIDYRRGFLRVVEVDGLTGLSKTVEWDPKKSNSESSKENLMLGSGPGYQSESWRVNIDTYTFPHKASLDGRLQNYGSDAAYMKLFLSNDITDKGQVISMMLDGNGNLLNENVPLIILDDTDPNNVAIRQPLPFWVNRALADGERVTAVIYGANGNELSEYSLLVRNTRLVRRVEAGYRYVQGIRVLSPFLSKADPSVLEFPININAKSLVLQGVVDYSDGSSSKPMAIGSEMATPFALLNFDNFVPTIENQRVPLTLRYELGKDEFTYDKGLAFDGSVTAPFYALVTPARNSYSVKLFAFPFWVNDVVGYELEFFLYSLERDVFYHVRRGLVETAVGSRGFDGLNFNTLQRVTFSVKLNLVNSGYTEYIHVQTMEISLKTPGTDQRTNWLVGWSPNTDDFYGEGLIAKITYINTKISNIDISCDIKNIDEWLDRLFYATEPLYNRERESHTPRPTHFRLNYSGHKTDYFQIGEFRNLFESHHKIDEGDNVYVEWILRTSNNDLQLGISALPAHQIN